MEQNRKAELAALRERHEQQKDAWERVKAEILALGDRTIEVSPEFFERMDAACAPVAPGATHFTHPVIRV